MCGIAGFLELKESCDWRGALGAMTAALHHRGPDASGVWLDSAAGVALGHARLSILDLSEEGSQPMRSPCGRYVIVYNGEIYNHLELRAELDRLSGGIAWRGHSDTEIMLAAVSLWGIEETIRRCVGMFAIALWDRQERALHLVRDRVGEKPLYYGFARGTFLFGSELKALRAHPCFDAEVDRDSLSLLLRYNCIPAPYSIYRGIKKLLPGHLLTLRAGDLARRELPASRPFWELAEVARTGMADPFTGGEREAVDALDALLSDAVGAQMLADVPLGAFLSGGIDSSTIVSLMQARSARPVRTFTIGFAEQGYNEAHHAKEVAKHLGTDHTELYVTPADALAVIPRLPDLYDEPFADASQVPTFLVSQLTRRHVTVALSGDAGDELFGGYNRYLWGPRVWGRVGGIPRPLRSAAASLLTAVPPARWDRLFELGTPLIPGSLRVRTPGDKLHKMAGILDASSPRELYRRLVSHWPDPERVVLSGKEPATLTMEPPAGCFPAEMMALDAVSYLPDDILVKVDRAAMGVSLETRVPFLDHRVVEFAWRLPLSLKIRDGVGKWILRQVLYRYVPRELVERPKAGFGIPIDAWLRGPLKQWGEELLSAERLKREGFFDPAPVRRAWEEHQSGTRNWQYRLWDILMFQCWLERQRTAN